MFGSWLGPSGPSPTPVPQVDVIISVGASLAADTMAGNRLTPSLETDSLDPISAADEDEATLPPPPARRGGGIGVNLKK